MGAWSQFTGQFSLWADMLLHGPKCDIDVPTLCTRNG
jgi:hypothetical protein